MDNDLMMVKAKHGVYLLPALFVVAAVIGVQLPPGTVSTLSIGVNELESTNGVNGGVNEAESTNGVNGGVNEAESTNGVNGENGIGNNGEDGIGRGGADGNANGVDGTNGGKGDLQSLLVNGGP